MACQRIIRRGMTLIELLVVVAIMLTLIIAVAPNLATTAEARRSREVARMVSSFVAKAQSRALGRSEWSGFMLFPAQSTSYAALDVHLADVPPPYRGDTVSAQLTFEPDSVFTSILSGSTGQLQSVLVASGTRGDLIRLNGRGPWFEIANSQDAVGITSIRFRLRGGTDGGAGRAAEQAGFEPMNACWPPPGPLTFEILRRPQPSGSPFSLPEGRVIDLRWSGFGPLATVMQSSMYRRFTTSSLAPSAYTPTDFTTDSPANSVSIVFDGTGRMRQVLIQPAWAGDPQVRFPVNGPVFLLVGRSDRAGQDPATFNAADDSTGANWQYSDSFWIVIDSMSGVPKVAECVPYAASSSDGYQELIASQAWIRRALLTDGR
jgi:prepilin-type N-terminal cleavage/methylation domain-containing protein